MVSVPDEDDTFERRALQTKVLVPLQPAGLAATDAIVAQGCSLWMGVDYGEAVEWFPEVETHFTFTDP